jgi:vacuolar-type H+-ATPase subunit E/Vma4
MTLETVSGARIAGAEAQADAIRAAATDRAERIAATARREARALIAEQQGVAERRADAEERERLATARAEARAVVLHAQRAVVDEARAGAYAAARRLLRDPRHARLIDRLTAEARDRLSAGGPVSIVPDPDGGFVARSGSRQIDYSFHAQVGRALDALGSRLEDIWLGS